MFPYTVSRLLLFTVGARRIVDALSVASRTTNAVLEGVESSGDDAREGDAESRGQADDGGWVTGGLGGGRAYREHRDKDRKGHSYKM